MCFLNAVLNTDFELKVEHKFKFYQIGAQLVRKLDSCLHYRYNLKPIGQG